MKLEFWGTPVPDRDAAGRLYCMEESEAPISTQDGGQAMIIEFSGGGAGDDGVFVRVHSWDSTRQHDLLDSLRGRRVRVTVEIVD